MFALRIASWQMHSRPLLTRLAPTQPFLKKTHNLIQVLIYIHIRPGPTAPRRLWGCTTSGSGDWVCVGDAP